MRWVIEPACFGRALVLTMSLATAHGCADNGKVHLAGNVTVDGVPVVQGTIGFFPADGEGPSAEAVIDSGAYSVTLVPGNKNVVIHGYQQVGEKFPWGRGAQAMPVLEEIVPEKFHAGANLTADVEGDQSDLNFDLITSEGGTP